jgi:UPF0271 protein
VPVERRTIDLNADLGEADDATGREVEHALLTLVTSVHIACGGHAGDEGSMREMVRAARDNGVRVGAHPSFPDRAGFGRQPMEMAADELASSLRQQIGALVDVTDASGTRVRSIKAHGALYGDVARHATTCEMFLGVVRDLCGTEVTVVLPSGAPAVGWARQTGMTVLEEGFADRAYTAEGGLLARDQPGSVYDDPDQAASQARGLGTGGTVTAVDGTVLMLRVDTPNAPALARAVGRALADAGIAVVAPSIPAG